MTGPERVDEANERRRPTPDDAPESGAPPDGVPRDPASESGDGTWHDV